MTSWYTRLSGAVTRRLDDYERVIIETIDSDAEWWPFCFLRPAPWGRLSNRRVAVLSLLYGLPAGLSAIILAALFDCAPTERRVFAFLAAVCLGVFVAYRFTIAFFWNRRASRLRSRG